MVLLNKSVITIAIMGFLVGISIPLAYAGEGVSVDKFERVLTASDAKAIPDWVNTTMGFYLDEKISERELLDAFNWLFENNVMHLSQEAAQEVHDLREKVSEQESAISSLRTLVSSQAMSNESGKFWFEDLRPGYYENASGERIMQPEFGSDTSEESKVIVRGGDPTKKETIGANKEAVQRFVVELYAESMYSVEGTMWIPVVEGTILSGFEDGDPDRPIIIGRIYNTQPTQAGSPSGEFWFEELKPGHSESTSGPQVNPSQIKVLIMANTADFDFASQTVKEVLRKGGTTSAWEKGIAAFTTKNTERSVVPELSGVIILCNQEIDKKMQQIEAEIDMIEQWLDIISEKQESSSYDASGRLTSTTTENETQDNQSDLDFIQKKLSSIDQQVNALNTGVEVLKEKLSSLGDDAQLANIDLQNKLQKQQQTLQTISNVSKMHHDTMMSIINNMR